MDDNMKNKGSIIVSACLLGINCNYLGENNKNESILNLREKYYLIPICPEQLGGLPTPRLSQAIVKGSGGDVLDNKTKVVNQENIDVTEAFQKGAAESLKIANILKIKKAILKEKSPSCGVKKIYNKETNTDERLVEGKGVTAALFTRNNITVISEEDKLEKLD